ncbi:MAG: hypothetical protein ACON5A_01940 [Candidatus Comchoanobacterales bacterium]
MKNNSQVHAIAAVDQDVFKIDDSFTERGCRILGIDPLSVKISNIDTADMTENPSEWKTPSGGWFSLHDELPRDATKPHQRNANTKITFSGSCLGSGHVEYKFSNEDKNSAALFMGADKQLKPEMKNRIHLLYLFHAKDVFHIASFAQIASNINLLIDTLYPESPGFLPHLLKKYKNKTIMHREVEQLHFTFHDDDPNKITVTMVSKHYHTGLNTYRSFNDEQAMVARITPEEADKVGSHSSNKQPLFRSLFQQTVHFHAPKNQGGKAKFRVNDSLTYVVFHHEGLYNAIKASADGAKRFKNVWMPKHENETCLWQSSAAEAFDPVILIEELKKESSVLSLQHTSNEGGLSVEASMKTEGRNRRIVSPAYRLSLRLKLVIGLFSILCVYLLFLASGSHPLVMFKGFQSFSDIRAIALIGLSVFGLYRLYSKPDNKHLYLVLKMILALFPLSLAICLVLTHGVPASLLVLSNARITSEIIVVASMMVATCISFVLLYKDSLDCRKFCHIVSNSIYGADKRQTKASDLRAEAAQRRMDERNAGANDDIAGQQHEFTNYG